MRDIFEVLREKEIQLSRLEGQIEALRVAAGIIADEFSPLGSGDEPAAAKKGPVPAPALSEAEPKAAAATAGTGHKLWP